MSETKIIELLEKRLSSYEIFEKMILLHLRDNYFSLVYQSLYNQLGYKNFDGNKFTTSDFKDLISRNNFLDLVNEIYRTRLSRKGVGIIGNRLQNIENFDDYETSINVFEECNPTNKDGTVICKNAFSFGTKILHFYNPQENPILDSKVRDNLKIKDEMNKKLCLEFRDAAKNFTEKHSEYFNIFHSSKTISEALTKRHMTDNFSTMEILDMALYEERPDI